MSITYFYDYIMRDHLISHLKPLTNKEHASSKSCWNMCRKLRSPPKNQVKTNVEEREDVGIKNELQNSEQT